SGPAGGGTVMIGGDWSGGHPDTSLVSNQSAKLDAKTIPTAATVTVDAATTINASATQSGNGGKVIVWSDGPAAFSGRGGATGGPNGGNGGFTEVSGHQHLDYLGTVDLRAPKGDAGTLLLDPRNVAIVQTGNDSMSPSSNGGTTTYTPDQDSSIIKNTTVQT